jgi:hypothetical protein
MSFSLSWTLALISAGLLLAHAIVYDSLAKEVNSKSKPRISPFEETEISPGLFGRRRWIARAYIRHKELSPNSRRRIVAKLLIFFAFITACAWRLTVKPQHRVENPDTVQAQQ